MSHTFIEAQHAAELVGLAVYARACLARAAAEEPDVVSLAFTVTFESPGLSVIECELRQASGLAVGGFSL